MITTGPETIAEEMLPSLLAYSKGEAVETPKIFRASESLRDLTALLLTSPRVLNMAQTVRLRFEAEGGLSKEFIRAVVGTVFEEIAYGYLSETKDHPGDLLTSPEETLDIYKAINVTRPVVNHDFSQSVDASTTPDGVFLKRSRNSWQIVGLCDYKTAGYAPGSRQHQRYKEHIEWLRTVPNLNEARPLIQPVIASITGENLPVAVHPKLRIYYGALVDRYWPNKITIPISSHEFSNIPYLFFRDLTEYAVVTLSEVS